jgi:hypothetical protein
LQSLDEEGVIVDDQDTCRYGQLHLQVDGTFVSGKP